MAAKPFQSTPKARLPISPVASAFSLVEVIVATGLLLVITSGLVVAMTYGREAATVAGSRQRAVLLAEEGTEAVRNLRDAGFSNLLNGTYGLSQSGGRWTLSGSSDTVGPFTRQIAIGTLDPLTKLVTSTVTWDQTGQRTGSVVLTSEMVSLDIFSSQANSLVVNTSGATLGGLLNRELRGVTVANAGGSSIAIDKVTVIWTNAASKIQQVSFGGTNAWTSTGPGTPAGKQNTGTLLDLQNVSLSPGVAAQAAVFQFDLSMVLNVFTITFTMADASTKTVLILTLL